MHGAVLSCWAALSQYNEKLVNKMKKLWEETDLLDQGLALTLVWLLQGDVSLKYQTGKYLLDQGEQDLAPLRQRIAQEGFGKGFLEARNPSGHWGAGFYQPKWVSSHYTLLDLRYLEMEAVAPIQETIRQILRESRERNTILASAAFPTGDVCVNGMFLNYASFFQTPEAELIPVLDYLLGSVMPDGGFNCDLGKSSAPCHSSMHSTISVLEGLAEFRRAGHVYRRRDLEQASEQGEEFLLRHGLFRSDKTGEVINPSWMKLSFPARWKYDILRALLYFAESGRPFDERMEDALAVLLAKQRKDGTWPVQAKHPGLTHFELEKTGGPSRFNTLRALRVFKAFGR